MTSAEAAVDWLCRDEAQVSAHYVLGRDGQLWQLVAEADRAWHAGAGSWAGAGDVNSRSIGIEIDNDGASEFPQSQITALVGLLRGIMHRWGIGPAAVIGHSDCSPGRKIDPGPLFPWGVLVAEGLAVAARTAPVSGADEAGFCADLAAVGYGAEVPPETLLAAFRLRHRPGADGDLTVEDCALARGLAQDHPVDRTRKLT